MGYFDFLSQPPKATQVSKERDVEPTSVITSAKVIAGSTVTANSATLESKGPIRRFSLRSLGLARKDGHDTALSVIQEQEKPKDSSKRIKVSRSDRLAKDSALKLRSLIVGPTSTTALQNMPVPTKSDLSNIRLQLMEPKTANQVIAKLKELPASDDPLQASKPGAKGPIHAVCLACTDAEMDTLHFSNLLASPGKQGAATSALPGVISASVDAVAALFNEMHIIDLIKAPDLGLGQPGDGEGILAGALPTAETVIEGVERITPELMTLGYATGKAIMPDHSGIV